MQHDQQTRAFSQLDPSRSEFNVPPAALSSKIEDGIEYVVIARTRQSDEPQVWSTGDQEQTKALLDQFYRSTETQSTT